MDSKLKAQVIACVSVIVLLILGTVYLINREKTAATGIQVTSMQQESAEAQNGIYAQYQLNPDKDPTAFLQDPDFFDVEPEEADQSKVLSLQASSTQKDLRIFVVDGNGNPVSGQQFTFRIAKDGAQTQTYEDEDQDGMLYLTDLAAGEYAVSLNPVDGYAVPDTALSASVSESVSYTVLQDISFLVKTEDEVDPAVEDTGVREAEEDADGTETNVRLADGASVFGIDVSKWNKEIDWQKVKAAGVEYAIIRCGYRGASTGALVEDPYFEKNIKNATEAGVRVGVYFFTQATTPVEAVEEASMVLMLCNQYKISFPLYIDTEGAGGNGRADGLDVETRTAVCTAFCETIENAGYTAGVYASKNWLTGKLDAQKLSSYSVWLAQYSGKPSYQGTYDMWQYTSAGTVDGISTLVDFNVSYMDY